MNNITLLDFFYDFKNNKQGNEKDFYKLKNEFLLKLKSKKGYKRYLESPLRYAGGKSWAVGYIVEKLPEIDLLVSPFFGGGSVEIAVAKELKIPVVGYDIFDILVNYWQVQINSPDLLFKELSQLKPNKETYKKVKEKLKEHWEGKTKLDKIRLAAYFYFNHNLSYGPMFLGWPSSVYLNEKSYNRMLNKVRNFRVNNIKVKVGDFKKTIPNHRRDFLYLDPPYYIGKDSKVFIGLYPNRNFPIFHKNFDHIWLRDLLKKHEGGFILSYNDSNKIKEWYNWADEIIKVPVHYTMGQGETRIGNNRKERGSYIKKEFELIIIKYPKQ
ncbi:MAG: DNA adenine methylase [Nanoarchaeota archaeon]